MLRKSLCKIIVFLSVSLIAQQENLKYNLKLTISEDLAHNGVTSILEDSKGFLWFGTYDGINRYDGYGVQTYKNTIDDDILTSNRVRALEEDVKGNLWIGTDGGITIYKYEQKKFIKLYSHKSLGKVFGGPIVRDFLMLSQYGLILCLTEGEGVLIFDEDYNFIGKFMPDKSIESKSIFFLRGVKIDKNRCLFSTNRGLFLFDLNTKKFSRVLKDDIASSNHIIILEQGVLLVTTLPKGMVLVGYSLENNLEFSVLQKKMQDFQFVDAVIDSNKGLWLGTLNSGIIKFESINELKKEKSKYSVFDDNLTILRSSKIVCTSKNNCWLATYNEGVYRFDVESSSFNSSHTVGNQNNGLITKVPNSITNIDENRVYLSSPFGGLTILNTKTRQFESLKDLTLKNISQRISSIYIDSKKNIWIRLYGEVNRFYRLKQGTNSLETIKLNDVSKSGAFSLEGKFAEDRFGNIWMGTNNDVFKLKLSNNNDIISVESLGANPFFKTRRLALVRNVYVDPLHDFIWLGTDMDGLIRVRYDAYTPIEGYEVNQFTKEDKIEYPISSNFVTSIVRLPNNELWLGTEGGGICKVNNSNGTPEFIPFTEKNGLSNNVVKNLLYDNQSNLWVATNVGLNKFSIKNYTFRKFSQSNGLPFEDFWFSAFALNNGTMIFSGVDDFCFFNPEEVSTKEELPKFEFENLTIFNKPINPKDTIAGRVLIDKNLGNEDELNLKYNENVFSVDVISLHYSDPKNHYLRYKLEPINVDWIEVRSNQNTISYNALPPGEYNLVVKASNSLGEWTIPKSLKIVITPPIWKTNLAYFVYLFVLISISYAVFRVVYKIQDLNHKVEIEQIELNNAKAVNEEKLRFFSNISHEIKTPLTLISSPINMLIKGLKNNPEAIEKLNLMQRQSKKILQLIEQVQDFRRADSNMLKITYSRFSFNDFVTELIEDFNFLASSDQKKLRVVEQKKNLIVTADKDKLEKVFNNLLNNAFKYTCEGDTITLEFDSKDKDLIVSVTDTGKGIDRLDIDHVFERFYQSHKKEIAHNGGSGIGLAFTKRLVEMHYGYINIDSELNIGTKVTVKLPIVKKASISDKLTKDPILLPKEDEVCVNKDFTQNLTYTDIEITSKFSNAYIYYAEDNLEMRTFVCDLLSKWFKVKSFRNGKDCLEALEQEWPDIIISDVQMPELNGLELCINIKSDLKTSHIPVILLTALTNIENHIQGLKDGADAYIKKPFNIQELVTTIEALLTNREQLRERYQVGIPLTRENNKNNRNDNAFLDKLYSLMETNLDNQNLDLNSLAKELFLNRTHFFKKVKALTNQTPFELLKNYRLKRASEFLVQKQLSVNEAFELTGFKSRTHFAKIFKEKYGVSPSKYASTISKKYKT